MSIVISLGTAGKHTPAAAELRTRQVEAGNRQLIAANEDLVCELTRHIIRGCQAEIRATELEAQVREHAATVQRIDERHAETVRGLERQLRDLQWRLNIATRANAAADQTQELDVRVIRDHYADGVLTLQQAHCIGPVLNPGRHTT